MNANIQIWRDIFALSFFFFLFFGVYTAIRIRMFIIKRYEQETDLLNTIFFKEFFTFCHIFPGMFRIAIYSFHLIAHVWGWDYWKKKKAFKGITDPGFVTQHFSKKEIHLVKRHTILIIIFLVYIAIYQTLKIFCPEVL